MAKIEFNSILEEEFYNEIKSKFIDYDIVKDIKFGNILIDFTLFYNKQIIAAFEVKGMLSFFNNDIRERHNNALANSNLDTSIDVFMVTKLEDWRLIKLSGNHDIVLNLNDVYKIIEDKIHALKNISPLQESHSLVQEKEDFINSYNKINELLGILEEDEFPYDSIYTQIFLGGHISNYQNVLGYLKVVREIIKELYINNEFSDGFYKELNLHDNYYTELDMHLDSFHLSLNKLKQTGQDTDVLFIVKIEDVLSLIVDTFFNHIPADVSGDYFFNTLLESISEFITKSRIKICRPYAEKVLSEGKTFEIEKTIKHVNEELAEYNSIFTHKTIVDIKKIFTDKVTQHSEEAGTYLAISIILVVIGFLALICNLDRYAEYASMQHFNNVVVLPSLALSAMYVSVVFFLLKNYFANKKLENLYTHKEELANLFLAFDNSEISSEIKNEMFKAVGQSLTQYDNTIYNHTGNDGNFNFTGVK